MFSGLAGKADRYLGTTYERPEGEPAREYTVILSYLLADRSSLIVEAPRCLEQILSPSFGFNLLKYSPHKFYYVYLANYFYILYVTFSGLSEVYHPLQCLADFLTLFVSSLYYFRENSYLLIILIYARVIDGRLK